MEPSIVRDMCAAVPPDERAAAMDELLDAVSAIHTRRRLEIPSGVRAAREQVQAPGREGTPNLDDR